jgi:predicted TIM-barrel fold metal-dependent hydrolase
MDACGIGLSVVCSIATNARQLVKVNSFAIDVNDFSTRLTALGSAHPDSEILEDELQRLLDHDIHGVKIHPEYGPYYIDSPEWDRVFALCEERNIFVVTHAGYDFISPDRIAATPDRLARILDRHPDLTLVAAHLGGNRMWDEVEKHLCGRRNLYFDTALLAAEGAPQERVLAIIRKHGADRILFGSDMPWSDPKDELTYLRGLCPDNATFRKITEENALALLYR